MQKTPLCIVGLGYVGLPLAHAFAKHGFPVIGFDINARRIEELKNGNDRTNELTPEQLREVTIAYSADPAVIGNASIIILAIPTPVDEHNKPDLTLVEEASRTVGKHLKKGAIVVYESTVYPGVTEELCGKILEEASGLLCGKDFTLGYSPERVNPGDREHTVETIVKIVSGQDEATLQTLADLYGSIVKAGIHRAPNIRVAEMAKAIENAQRDINIAYINEISMLCNHLGLKTTDVLEAAGTKWNFLRFQPGLVGGHCIGVDPYYLVEKAKQLGMDTQLIAAGRSINDSMASFIAKRVCVALNVPPKNARILVLGLTFKEDVPDTRNSKVHDVIASLQESGATVEAHDPFLTPTDIEKMKHTPGSLEKGPYDAILLLVPHRQYKEVSTAALIHATTEKGLIYDLKSILDEQAITGAGRRYESL